MCCDKLATTQYFLKKNNVVAEKNKAADTCHHIASVTARYSSSGR